MECPVCSHDNIEGVDECARCLAPLTDLSIQTHRSDIEHDLLTHPLGDLATGRYLEAAPSQTVDETLRAWADARQHCVIVTDLGRVVGILTERDVLNKLAHDYVRLADRPVAEFMTPDPVCLEADVPVAFGLNQMMVGGYRHIPVTRDGRLAGVVSVRDVLSYLSARFSDATAMVSGAA